MAPKSPRTWISAIWHRDLLPRSVTANCYPGELQAVIQESADWIESQQASLQQSNDFKAQTILQKAA